MMSSVDSAAWSTAQESPTVGYSLMATQQVGVPSLALVLSTVGLLCLSLGLIVSQVALGQPHGRCWNKLGWSRT